MERTFPEHTEYRLLSTLPTRPRRFGKYAFVLVMSGHIPFCTKRLTEIDLVPHSQQEGDLYSPPVVPGISIHTKVSVPTNIRTSIHTNIVRSIKIDNPDLGVRRLDPSKLFDSHSVREVKNTYLLVCSSSCHETCRVVMT